MKVYRRSRRWTTSNNLVFENDDILMEILLRLPMKVKVLCKAVCKRWFSLISSAWFANCVLFRENNNLQWNILYKLRCSKGGLKVAFRHYPELNSQNLKLASLFSGQQNIQLVDADNGLILCAKCEVLFCKQREYFVCNPITGQLVSLPKPQVHEHVFVGFRVSCHNGTTTYKVVRAIIDDKTRLISHFEVFSSDVGDWRNSAVSRHHHVTFDLFDYDKLCGSVNYKGILHWLLDEEGGIIAYDPDRNKVRIIKMPSNLHRPPFGRIGMSCGYICYIHLNLFLDSVRQREKEEEILSIWTLDNYDTEKWRLVHKINVNSVPVIYQIPINKLSFVFHPYDIDVVYLEALLGKMASLNLQTRKLASVEEEVIIHRLYYGEGSLYPYVVPPLPTPVPQPIWETD